VASDYWAAAGEEGILFLKKRSKKFLLYEYFQERRALLETI